MFHAIGRFLRHVFYGTDFILITVASYLLSYLPSRWVSSFYPQLFRVWCRSFVRALGVELYLHQKNRRPLPGRYLLVANHPSAFEDIGIPALFPVYSLAKIEVRDWWVVGRISRAAGTLYVHREERASRREAFDQVTAALTSGKSVAIYPEGGCKGRRIFETFRYGPFEIAMRTSTPVLPVFLHYESQDDFEWGPGQLLPEKIWHILRSRNKRVNYYVYDAINPDEFADQEELMGYVHDLYLSWQARYLD